MIQYNLMIKGHNNFYVIKKLIKEHLTEHAAEFQVAFAQTSRVSSDDEPRRLFH